VPYLPPPPYDTAFLEGAPEITSERHQQLLHGLGTHAISAEDRKRLIAQYDGGIAYEDFALHKLFARLKSMGLYDRSLIIVTSDHGEAFDEHGSWGHGSSTHAEQVNVPLIVKYPGQTTGAIVQDRASQVDLLPTILEVLGYPASANLQGRSLVHPAAGDRELFAESVTGRALQSGPLKLIVAANGKRELYDVAADPHESHNLYSPLNPTANALDIAFTRWMGTVPGARARSNSPQDREELRRLRSLGYVQ